MAEGSGGGAGRDLIFFILLIVVLFVVWALSGGPARSISKNGLFINPPAPLGSGTSYNVPGVKLPYTNDTGEAGTIGRIIRGTGESVISFLNKIGGPKTYGETSPFQGKVTLSEGRPNADTPGNEYVEIDADRSNSEQVDITGWRIESAQYGFGTTIPAGSYLPYANAVNPTSDILLLPGARAYVTTGRSPIGVSFRTNECTGYFAQFQNFTPSLSRSCPLPEDEIPAAANFNKTCRDYIARVSRCSIVTGTMPQNLTSQCVDFLTNTLTYNGCVSGHKDKDQNFYSSEWRVFLGRDSELWNDGGDTIVLLDTQSKVVDAISY